MVKAIQFRRLIGFLLMAGWPILADAADLGDDSPFLPPGSGQVTPPAAVPVATLANLEFASVMSFGGTVLVSVHNLQTESSVWIPVGGEEEGIRVIAYDNEAGEVTVHSLGVTTRLKLREAAITNGTWIKPLPTLEQEYGRPLTIKEEETEARMLVSDLLEIGMKERERQRELRKKKPSKLIQN